MLTLYWKISVWMTVTLVRLRWKKVLVHWYAAKRVLKYLKGSTDYIIKYGPTFMGIAGYSDASFPKAPIDDSKSVSGVLFMFYVGSISWKTHRPSTYSTEAFKGNFSKESSHINTKHHSIKQYVEVKQIILKYCRTNDMLADGLTKALKRIKFKKFIESLNLCHRPKRKVEPVT